MKSKSKKAFEHNIEAEMDSGKSQPQSLAIAYSIKRKPKKMAAGGAISANDEKRPMPDNKYDDGKEVSNNSGNKSPKNDNWLSQPTVEQARKPSRIPLKHPKMVPSDAFSVRLRDQEDHLESSAKPGKYDSQPPKEDDEMGADRSGPKVSDMQPEHNNHRKPYAKGGMINDKFSMKSAEDDKSEHPEGLESDDDMLQPEDDYMSGEMEAKPMAAGGSVRSGSHDMDFADGGMIDDMEDQPEPEEDIEHDASIAGAIMKRRKMADGGILSHDSIYSDDSDQADISRNADEDANEEDQLSFNALRKENYNESEGLKQMNSPKDSNEHGHNLPDEDRHDRDMISAIRSRMKKRSAITR